MDRWIDVWMNNICACIYAYVYIHTKIKVLGGLLSAIIKGDFYLSKPFSMI